MFDDDVKGRHLYVMAYGESLAPLKIGRSTNPLARAASLSASHAFRVRVLCAFPHLGHLEGRLHRAFDARRVEEGRGREWFHVDLGEIVQEVDRFWRETSSGPRPANGALQSDLLAGRLPSVEAKAAVALQKARVKVDAAAAGARAKTEAAEARAKLEVEAREARSRAKVDAAAAVARAKTDAAESRAKLEAEAREARSRAKALALEARQRFQIEALALKDQERMQADKTAQEGQVRLRMHAEELALNAQELQVRLQADVRALKRPAPSTDRMPEDLRATLLDRVMPQDTSAWPDHRQIAAACLADPSLELWFREARAIYGATANRAKHRGRRQVFHKLDLCALRQTAHGKLAAASCKRPRCEADAGRLPCEGSVESASGEPLTESP